MLSLPIPQGTKETRFSIKYYPRSLSQRPKLFTFNVSDFTTIQELKTKILEGVPEPQRAHLPFMTRIRNRSVSDLLDREKFIKSFVDRGDEVAAYERMALPE